jgi:murein DD-endopeptidase MepM/ murein hydrolase activator NlpD
MSSYEVKRGDTLSQIAKQYNMDYKELARNNKISNPDKIYVGQKIVVPSKEPDMAAQVQAAQQPVRKEPVKQKAPVRKEPAKQEAPVRKEPVKQEAPSLMSKPSRLENPVRNEDPLIPTNVRQFVYDLFGGSETLTEQDLKQEEKEALRKAALRAQRQGKKAIEYSDYGTQTEGQSQYADVGGGGGALDFVTKVFDPEYSMKTTVGQARIEQDDEGNTIIVDRYNFNDSDDKFSFTGLMSGIKRAGFSPYAQLRNIARELGSGEGEGSEVRINLGKLASTDVKKIEGLI